MKVTFLGTGTSVGVPVIGCECEVCTSENPKNSRTRSSVFIEWEDSRILVDTSVDFRRQMLREGIRQINAILFTHAHADHIMGLDDVRPLNKLIGGSIDVYGHPRTLETIRDTFDYMFEDTANNSWKPKVTLNELEPERTRVEGVPVRPLPVEHGNLDIYGYRIGPVAYISDVSTIPESTHRHLNGLDVLVLDALRDRDHPTHLTVEQAVDEARQIGADRTYFTHMTHDIAHETLSERLPDDIRPAFDGLTLDIPGDRE